MTQLADASALANVALANVAVLRQLLPRLARHRHLARLFLAGRASELPQLLKKKYINKIKTPRLGRKLVLLSRTGGTRLNHP